MKLYYVAGTILSQQKHPWGKKVASLSKILIPSTSGGLGHPF